MGKGYRSNQDGETSALPSVWRLLSSPGLDTDMHLPPLIGNTSSACLLQMLHLLGNAAQSEKIPTMPEWISLGLAATSPQSKEDKLTYCKLMENLSRQSRPGERREEGMLKGPGAVVEALLAPVNDNWRGKRESNRDSGYKYPPTHPMGLSSYTKPPTRLLYVISCWLWTALLDLESLSNIFSFHFESPQPREPDIAPPQALPHIPRPFHPLPSSCLSFFFLRPTPQLSLNTNLGVWCQRPFLTPLLPKKFSSVSDSGLFLILHREEENSVSESLCTT